MEMGGLSIEERVGSLFQPDTLLPDQYLETFRRKYHLESEKRLMLAVLEDAIAIYQKYLFPKSEKEKSLFRDAEDWILEEGSDWLFCFENICEALGMHPGYVKQGLVRWKEKELQEKNSKIKLDGVESIL